MNEQIKALIDSDKTLYTYQKEMLYKYAEGKTLSLVHFPRRYGQTVIKKILKQIDQILNKE